MDRTETRLVEVLNARLGVTPKLSSRISELNLDSLRIFELISELEYEFEARFDQDVLELETIADLAAYIRERQPETSQRV